MRVGIDLGGSKTEAVLISADGSAMERLRRPTPVADGYEAILQNVVDLVRELESQTAERLRVGIGTPGSLSARTGLLKNSTTVCLTGQPVKADLERLLGREIRIANDANCFALSEAIDGAGADHGVVFGIIMGTGVGGGIAIDGRVHEGRHQVAGEWGHNVLEADGPPCYCGKHGCVETFLSGPGLARDYQEHGGTAGLNAQNIIARSRAGDIAAIAAVERFLDRFGRALSLVVNILDPDAIVLGGGLSNFDRLYTEGRERLARSVFNDEFTTPVLRNIHGDSAGVLGAAWLLPPNRN
ncbi:MAG: ROK family protein [Acidiferrobacteraceae bacterium]